MSYSSHLRPKTQTKSRPVAGQVKNSAGVQHVFKIDSFQKVQRSDFGSTNCALPFEYALKNKIPVDAFVVITDNETNGRNNPARAIEEYRNRMGITERTCESERIGLLLGPHSHHRQTGRGVGRNQMDVVGFDASAPAIIADFVRGPAKRTRRKAG